MAKPAAPAQRPSRAATSNPDRTADKLITEAQRTRLFAVARECGVSHDQLKSHLAAKYQILTSKDIPVSRYEEICQWVQGGDSALHITSDDIAVATASEGREK